jgi:hypothetical protein
MPHIASYKELRVYQAAISAAMRIFQKKLAVGWKSH